MENSKFSELSKYWTNELLSSKNSLNFSILKQKVYLNDFLRDNDNLIYMELVCRFVDKQQKDIYNFRIKIPIYFTCKLPVAVYSYFYYTTNNNKSSKAQNKNNIQQNKKNNDINNNTTTTTTNNNNNTNNNKYFDFFNNVGKKSTTKRQINDKQEHYETETNPEYCDLTTTTTTSVDVSSPKIINELLKIKPIYFTKRGSSYTNFLPCSMYEYFIHSYNRYTFFENIQKSFPFFVDFFMYSKVNKHLEFNIQRRKNLGSVFSLRRLLESGNFSISERKLINNRTFLDINLSYKKKCELNNMVKEIDNDKYDLDNIKGSSVPSNSNQKFFKKALDSIHDDFFHAEYDVLCSSEIYIKSNFTTLCFDIEVGFHDKYENGFPKPTNSYCQCIAFLENVFNKGYNKEETVKSIFVYLHSNMRSSEVFRVKYKEFCKKYNVYFYTNELTMISDFLLHLSTKDFIYGYNSREFDLVYLVNRYGILNYLNNDDVNNQTNFNQIVRVMDFIQRVDIDHFKLDTLAGGEKIKLLYEFDFYFFCNKCNKKVVLPRKYTLNNSKILLRDNTGSLIIVTCLNCKKNYTETFTIEICKLSIEKRISGYLKYEFPMSYHVDLILNQDLTNNIELQNKRLETLTIYYFRKKVYRIHETGNYLIVILNDPIDKSEMVNFGNIFLENIKTVTFNVEKITNQLVNCIELKTKDLIFFELDEDTINKDAPDEKDKYYKQYDNIYDSIINNYSCSDIEVNNYGKTIINTKNKQEQHKFVPVLILSLDKKSIVNVKKLYESGGNIFISIGKTSDLEMSVQQHWETYEHVYLTSNYCIKDTEITMQLEYMINSILNVKHSPYQKLCVYDTLSMNAPGKSEFEYVYDLYEIIFIFVFKSFNQLNILGTLLLEFEYSELKYTNEQIVEFAKFNNCLYKSFKFDNVFDYDVNIFGDILKSFEKKNKHDIIDEHDKKCEKILKLFNTLFELDKEYNNNNMCTTLEPVYGEPSEEIVLFKNYTLNNMINIFTNYNDNNINEFKIKTSGEYDASSSGVGSAIYNKIFNYFFK